MQTLRLLAAIGVASAALLPLAQDLRGQDEPQKSDSQQSTEDSLQSFDDEPGWYMGREIARTMSYHGADWLVRNSRDQEEEPRRLIEALELELGQQVCDFGCGNGFYTLQLAQLVGPHGKVFAVDIQPEMLELLKARYEPRGLSNIHPVLATADDPQLPPQKLDLVLMVDVYHELSHPAEVLRAVRQQLNPRGRVALVEFREEDPSVPIKPLHKMSQAQALKELTANGLKLVGQFDQLPWQHVLFYARDDSPRPGVQLRAWRLPETQTAKSPVIDAE